jgi:glycosyltransferase involved in cell wall biosynthesis
MPTVSVIIPTYNCARFLAESLESIFAQTVPPTETIVVDDGSTDETPEVLARYGDRITVVRGQHGGYAAARNLGLARARGDWIASHDADDVALTDRLALQLDVVRRHPDLDAVFCDGERMARPGDPTERLVPRHIARRCAGQLLTPTDLFDGYPAFYQGALIARRAFQKAGTFDITLQVHPDMDYAYRLLACSRALFIDRCVFRYRWHDANVTRDRLKGREEIARILERVDCEAPATARAIGRRRLRFRLARHYYRIARTHLARADHTAARGALSRAVALRPLNLRYRILHSRQKPSASRTETS